jgi:hypothetical protein
VEAVIPVTLTTHEIRLVGMVALERRIASLSFADKHGYDGTGAWDVEINSAAGELAVAKALNLYWDGSVNTFKKPDVGRYQVRHTKLPHGCLIVRPGDPDEDTYVLVTGEIPVFKVLGEIDGRTAKSVPQKDHGNGRPPAHFVPQEMLS